MARLSCSPSSGPLLVHAAAERADMSWTMGQVTQGLAGQATINVVPDLLFLGFWAKTAGTARAQARGARGDAW